MDVVCTEIAMEIPRGCVIRQKSHSDWINGVPHLDFDFLCTKESMQMFHGRVSLFSLTWNLACLESVVAGLCYKCLLLTSMHILQLRWDTNVWQTQEDLYNLVLIIMPTSGWLNQIFKKYSNDQAISGLEMQWGSRNSEDKSNPVQKPAPLFT